MRTLGLALMAWGTFALSCNCPPVPPVSKAVEQAKAVFLGRVQSVRVDDEGRGLVIKAVVQKIWKGSKSREVTLTTATSQPACGFPFKVGTIYVVYADGQEPGGTLRVSLCSRTRALDKASEDLEQLGAGSGPERRP